MKNIIGKLSINEKYSVLNTLAKSDKHKKTIFAIQRGLELFVLVGIVLFFAAVNNVFASANIDTISVTESCYPETGGTITINYRIHNQRGYSVTMTDAVLITDTSDSTPNWNDPCAWNSTGAPNPPTMTGFTGYSQGSMAAGAYKSISHVVYIPSSWTGTKRIQILIGDGSSAINFPDQYNQQYMEADTSYTITECSAVSPSPTGVQNRADSDVSTTNAVAFIVFSPTPSVTYSRTPSPTLTRTLSATLTWTLTPSLTWTLTPTLTWTLSVTLTPTLTFTLTPPVVIVLTKTIDKHIYNLGEQVNYCLIYTNTGTSSASFTVWDTIPGITDFVSCTAGCSQTTYGSERVLSWDITSLGVGASAQVCFVVQVNRLPYMRGKEFFALFDRKKYQEYSYFIDESILYKREYLFDGQEFLGKEK